MDICLPFVHPNSKKIYLGRYIAYGGKLIGIRLCTVGTGGCSAWRRNKLIKTAIKGLGSENTSFVGEFSIKTKNARIGLLFSS